MQTTVKDTVPDRDAVAPPSMAAGRPGLTPVARRNLLIAAGALVAVLLIAWGVVVTGKRKTEFAARSLDQARSIAETGNLTQASTQLQQLIRAYPGTAAAQEAALALNQVRLINNQNELAVVSLKDFVNTKHDAQFDAPANALLGAAYENSQKPAEAAEAFKQAAASAQTEYLKAEYLVEAGRAYRNAGKTTDAIAAYRQVVEKYSKTSSKTEAEVRLAELTSGKM